MICNDNSSSLEDSSYLALSYVANDSLLATESILKSLSRQSRVSQIANYELLFKKSQFKEAFFALKESSEYESIMFRNRIENDLTSSLHIMHHNEIITGNNKIKHLTNSIWILILAILLFIIAGLFIGYVSYKRIKEKHLIQTQIQMSLEELLEEKDRRLNLDVSQTNNIRNELRKILLSKYEFLNAIGKLIYENPDTKIAEKKITKSFNLLIDNLSKDDRIFSDLEAIVNSSFANLMVKFRIDLPELKDIDYNLYLLSIFNFSYSTISLLLKKEAIESLYQRKKRLKQRIKNLDSVKSEYYLSFIE